MNQELLNELRSVLTEVREISFHFDECEIYSEAVKDILDKYGRKKNPEDEELDRHLLHDATFVMSLIQKEQYDVLCHNSMRLRGRVHDIENVVNKFEESMNQ